MESHGFPSVESYPASTSFPGGVCLTTPSSGKAVVYGPVFFWTQLKGEDLSPFASSPCPAPMSPTGSKTVSFAGTVGASSIPNSSTALTPFPDGRAEAVYNSESPEITVNAVDDVRELVCLKPAPHAVTLEGRHEDGHVAILISTRDLVAFKGDYTADELVVVWRFTRNHPADDVMVQSIVDHVFHLFHQGG